MCDVRKCRKGRAALYRKNDHDNAAFEAKKKTLALIAKMLNEKYGEGTVALTITDQYQNMAEKIKPCMHLIENAQAVMRELGYEPEVTPVRGGTDGARLSYDGLPCPNLGTGGYAFHGPFEHITARAWMWRYRSCSELLRSMRRNKRRISEYKIFEVQNLCSLKREKQKCHQEHMILLLFVSKGGCRINR